MASIGLSEYFLLLEEFLYFSLFFLLSLYKGINTINDFFSFLAGLQLPHAESKAVMLIAHELICVFQEFTGHKEFSQDTQKILLEDICKSNPKVPVRKLFKRYVAKSKGDPLPANKAAQGELNHMYLKIVSI